MRLAVEFKRYGAPRYCSHLDMQRTAMRLVRRTEMKPEYTAGFNPHMVMSFASAMPVGLESDSEYFEIRLRENADPADCLRELQAAAPEGIEPVFTGVLPENAPKLMAALKFAGYEAVFEAQNAPELKKAVANLLQSDMIEIETDKDGRKMKKNIRPLVKELLISDDGKKMEMLLAASSEGSLNPELLLKHLAETINGSLDYRLKRTGLFTLIEGEIRPLRDLCK